MRILYVKGQTENLEIDTIFSGKQYTEQTDPELVIVAGGDGSLLHAIQSYKHLGVPFFGVASGTLNFLMNKLNQSEANELKIMSFEDFKLKYTFEKSQSFRVNINRRRTNGTDNIIFSSEVMNDIVLGGNIMDYNSFLIENKIVKSMGLIISTPLGSTAFNKNNNGDLIENLNSQKVIFSTIVANNNFSIKKDISEIPNIEIKSTRSVCSIYIDGTVKTFTLKLGDIVSISKSENIVLSFKDKNDFKSKRYR